MVSFLNFGSNITDTYNDPSNVYNIDAVNNYVDHLGATVASDELTITLGRTGSLADLQHTVTLPTGGGGTVSNEHIRDTIATFATAGDNMTIVHQDAANRLVFSANSPLTDVFASAIALTSIGVAWAMNIEDPPRSRRLGSAFSGGPDLHDGTFFEGEYYVAGEGADHVWRVDLVTLTSTDIGTMRPTITEIEGFEAHLGTLYALQVSGSRAGLYTVDLDDLSAATQISASLPSGMLTSGRMISFGGSLYYLDGGAKVWRIDTTTPANSVNVGNIGLIPNNNYGGLVGIKGKVYGVTSQTRGLYEIDLENATKVFIGETPVGTASIDAMAAVSVGLSTTFVPEGVNLYFTNARVDARVDNLFDFNPTTTPTHQLRTLTYDSDTYQVRSTFAVSTLSDRPAASASTVGHMYHILQNDTAYVGTNDKHVASAPEGDFAAIPARSDLHIVANLPTGSTLNNASTGDFYFHNGGSVIHGGYEFYEVEVHGAAKVLTNVHPDDALAASRSNNSWSVEWLGAEDSEGEALAYTFVLLGQTDYFYLDTTDDTIKRLDRSTYVGPGQTANHYRWLAIGGDSGGGGTGTDTNDYVDDFTAALSGQDLTMTLGRTGTLADLEQTVTLPAGGGTSDTKVVTSLPDPGDVADADKGKVWIVQSMADGGSEEVDHFTPIDEHIMSFTAESFTVSSETVIGWNATHGHALPGDTNIDHLYWDTVDNYTQLQFTTDREPFDFHDWTQFAFYMREADSTGDWYRLWMEETSGNSGIYRTQGAQARQSIHAGVEYHLILRHITSQVLNQDVATVPSTNRLSMFPGGGRFRAFADIDALGHLSVVTEVNRVVDGEVDSVALALAGQDLTLTVGRTVGADLTTTQTLPGGLPLAGGTLTGALEITPGNVSDVVLTLNKGGSGNNPVLRMVHPNNQTAAGQRPFNARRDGEFDYFEVNGRLGGTNAQPGIAIGPGGSSGRDVTLFRDAADVWRTPDAFHVGELRVDSAGRADSRTQLGLGTVATFNSGVIQGAIPTLGSGGLWDAARIPGLAASKITSGTMATARLGSGTANSGTVLHGNGAWAAVAAGGTFDIHDDVTTQSTIVDADLIVFSDEGSAGDPMRYTTASALADYMQVEVQLNASRITAGTLSTTRLGSGTASSTTYLRGDQTWATVAAGGTFDIHDDVTTGATIVDDDRIPFSDEGSAGDPMRYTTASALADYMQVEVQLNASRVTNGAFSTARIPNLAASKITTGTLATARLGTGTASSTTYLRGDQTWAAVAAGGTFDIHDDVTTAATIVDSDRIAFSDENTTGDPMRYTTAANLADYMQAEIRINTSVINSGRLDVDRQAWQGNPSRIRRIDA